MCIIFKADKNAYETVYILIIKLGERYKCKIAKYIYIYMLWISI